MSIRPQDDFYGWLHFWIFRLFQEYGLLPVPLSPPSPQTNSNFNRSCLSIKYYKNMLILEHFQTTLASINCWVVWLIFIIESWRCWDSNIHLVLPIPVDDWLGVSSALGAYQLRDRGWRVDWEICLGRPRKGSLFLVAEQTRQNRLGRLARVCSFRHNRLEISRTRQTDRNARSWEIEGKEGHHARGNLTEGAVHRQSSERSIWVKARRGCHRTF